MTSLGCARCGDCCDPVHLNPDNVAKVDRFRAQLAEGREVPPDTSATESLPFIVSHWTEIERDERGASYSCGRYDQASRTCTAHDGRPDVCRDFPWYSDESADSIKKRQMDISPNCSFLLDVPAADRRDDARPLIPLTPVAAPVRA